MTSVHVAFVVAAALALGGCSTLIRSDDAEFGDPSIDVTAKTASACRFLGSPRYLKAPEPRKLAFFGATLGASGKELVVSAMLETDSLDDEPPRGQEPCVEAEPLPEVTDGAGSIRIYEEPATELNAPSRVFRHAAASPALLPPERLEGLAQLARVSTHPTALNDSWFVVGEAGSDDFRGAVRFHSRLEGGWDAPETTFARADGQSQDLFGLSLALAGNTLVVGAPGEDRGAENAGAAYVYELTPSGAELVATLATPERRAKGWFGSAVTVSADWIVVTAPGDVVTNVLGDEGHAYAYRRNGSAVDESPHKIPRPADARYFGISAALDGDWLALGAPGTLRDETFMAGSVHLFQVPPDESEWLLMQTVTAGDHPGVLFGWSVALTPEALLVGYPFASGSLVAKDPALAGSLHVFERHDSGVQDEPCRILAPNLDCSDGFGTAMVAGEDFVAVGAPYEDGAAGGDAAPDLDNGLIDPGAVYVFPLNRTQ